MQRAVLDDVVVGVKHADPSLHGCRMRIAAVAGTDAVDGQTVDPDIGPVVQVDRPNHIGDDGRFVLITGKGDVLLWQSRAGRPEGFAYFPARRYTVSPACATPLALAIERKGAS